jgi:integrase
VGAAITELRASQLSNQLGPTAGFTEEEMRDASALLMNELAPGSLRTYESLWKRVVAECEKRSIAPYPLKPSHLAILLALSAMRGLKPNSCEMVACAVNKAHVYAGYSPLFAEPIVKAMLRAIAKAFPGDLDRKLPICIADLRTFSLFGPRRKNDVAFTRDMALLFVMHAMAARAGEGVMLDMDDIERFAQGLIVHLRQSKTGPARVPIAHRSETELDAIRRLDAWLALVPNDGGAIFRPVNKAGKVAKTRLSTHSVGRIVKQYVGLAGGDEARYGGHSMRPGHATDAKEANVADGTIMQVMRLKTPSVLQNYWRSQTLFSYAYTDLLGVEE